MNTQPRTRACGFVVIASATLATACLGGTTRGTPLYSTQGRPYPVTEVAQLLGDIASVDGQDVSGRGRTFELLPGCHVVTMRTSWGERDQSGSMSGNMPKRSLAINMQANRRYLLEYELASRTGNGGTLMLDVREQDAAGRTLAALLPTENQAELDRCQASAGTLGNSARSVGR